MASDVVVKNDELIDPRLIRQWLACGFFWLLFAPTVGVIVSTKFTSPEFLGNSPYLTFGRLRPIHVNGVIFGAFSTLFIGLAYYVVPRLAGVRMSLERWGPPLLWVWNLNLALGMVLLALGWNRGWEAGEFPLVTDSVLLACLFFLTVQHLLTIKRRREPRLYVSLWYLIAAFVWTDVNLVLLLVGPAVAPGVTNAAIHGLFIHNMMGLWITPAGFALIYYFLPASVNTPIYSHRLSLIGFWSLAFFFPFIGIGHYLHSPIADWSETIAVVSSMLLIVPAFTVIQNFFGTMIGRWREFNTNLPARFLIVGSVLYLLGCFQGSIEALRSVQEPTHFTDFVIAHSHLTIFGTFVIWAIGGALYVWPRLHHTGAEHPALLEWGFWLTALGISVMTMGLIGQGLYQGFILMGGTEWMHSVAAIRSYWWMRTIAGISMDIGMSLLIYTLMLSSLRRAGVSPLSARQ